MAGPGQLAEIDRRSPVQSFIRLAGRYGPIYRMQLPGRQAILLSGYLVDDACDEKRFDKKIQHALQKIRAFTGDGLFTA